MNSMSRPSDPDNTPEIAVFELIFLSFIPLHSLLTTTSPSFSESCDCEVNSYNHTTYS